MESGTNMFYTESDRGGLGEREGRNPAPKPLLTPWLEVGLQNGVHHREALLYWDGRTSEVFIFLDIYTILIRATLAYLFNNNNHNNQGDEDEIPLSVL